MSHATQAQYDAAVAAITEFAEPYIEHVPHVFRGQIPGAIEKAARAAVDAALAVPAPGASA